jgi:hypothetical protein
MSDLRISTPCQENWDAMTPVESGRHCASCNHLVIDVASMPVAEGRRVLREVSTTLVSEGTFCLRAHTSPTGRLVPGRRKLLTTALAGILACSLAGCVGDGPDLTGSQTKPHAAHEHATTSPEVTPPPSDGLQEQPKTQGELEPITGLIVPAASSETKPQSAGNDTPRSETVSEVPRVIMGKIVVPTVEPKPRPAGIKDPNSLNDERHGP